MKKFLQRYIAENFDDLLEMDLKLARVLGAPAPHTLSSWSHLNSPFWAKIINLFFKWVFDQDNHCELDYNRVVNGLQSTFGNRHKTESKTETG
jgi:hypothetical protein